MKYVVSWYTTKHFRERKRIYYALDEALSFALTRDICVLSVYIAQFDGLVESYSFVENVAFAHGKVVSE